jgi:hypothetical protein
MKGPPPSPGWIERVYRVGVGLAIPLTIIAGVVLLLTAREQQSAARRAGPREDVVMALPLQEARPSVELHPAHPACKPEAGSAHPCPTGPEPKH